MALVIYNSLTNKMEEFKPINGNKVNMYVCGPTVYGYIHIGNARPVIFYDMMKRYLEFLGYEVTYASNITDVDDKIINKAIEQGKTEEEVAKFYEEQYWKAVEMVGSRKPDLIPHATAYIPEMISFINDLIKEGYAYGNDGDVFFRVGKIKDYGCLSNQVSDDLESGARIAVNDKKESPLDFALWKKTDKGIKWDSPFGAGRPGWHTECVCMNHKLFGEVIDIHGGGYDLKFPHHENEIAQSEATHHSKIAHFWMHNAFINFGNEKMSKSLGNVVLAKDMIATYGGLVTRLVILNAHYRQAVNFTDETVKEAQQEVSRMQMAYKQAALKLQANKVNLDEGKPEYIAKFLEALANDLNTANALAELYNVLKDVNQLIRSRDADLNQLNNLFKTLTDMFYVLGLDITYVKFDDNISHLYEEYLLSKENKNFAKSDEIRKVLIEKGVM